MISRCRTDLIRTDFLYPNLNSPIDIIHEYTAEGYVHYIKDTYYGENTDGEMGSVTIEVDELSGVYVYDGPEIILDPDPKIKQRAEEELINYFYGGL